MTARLRRAARGDDGQVALLAIAYGALALLLVTVVVSASGIHLERKELFALADLTALDAADALDDDAYFTRDTSGAPAGDAAPGLVRLTDASVRAAAQDYLGRAPAAAGLEGVTLVDATTPDGRTATVTLRALARPALLSWVTAPWSDGVVLEVTASARAG